MLHDTARDDFYRRMLYARLGAIISFARGAERGPGGGQVLSRWRSHKWKKVRARSHGMRLQRGSSALAPLSFTTCCLRDFQTRNGKFNQTVQSIPFIFCLNLSLWIRKIKIINKLPASLTAVSTLKFLNPGCPLNLSKNKTGPKNLSL